MRLFKMGLSFFLLGLIFLIGPQEKLMSQEAQNIWRVSVSSAGVEGDVSSKSSSISADGRFVAFESLASNLVDGDGNGESDVFVHDRTTSQTSRVSINSNGAEGNNWSSEPSISADGRFVAFESRATNLVDGDGNKMEDIFVHDRTTRQTSRVSINSNGEGGNRWSSLPSISADGRFVAFVSEAFNLVDGDGNNTWDIFVHDRTKGQTSRVSINSNGAEGNNWSSMPSISADGRFVSFDSRASNLVNGDGNNMCDVFVRDRTTKKTSRVSMNSNGAEGNDGSTSPSISADGRFVAFGSSANNLVDGDGNDEIDVFVRDRRRGQTSRVSMNSNGAEGNFSSHDPSISADGRFVAFGSSANNLVDGETNGYTDIFVVRFTPPVRR